MKYLDMGKYQTETEVQIQKATLTILDLRSGKIADKVFYRPASKFPFDVISRTLRNYGYDVIGYKDETYVEGVFDWKSLFEGFEKEEKK